MATSKTAAPAGKKTTTAKKAAPAAAKPKTAKPASSRKKAAIVTSDERYRMIEVAAYYVAEKNGFGSEHMEYWLQAEKEVDSKLNA